MRSKIYVSALSILLFVSSFAYATPPIVEIPQDQLKPVQGYVTMTPKGNAKGVTYVSLSNVYPLPQSILRDPRQFVLPVAGLKEGIYTFVAVGSLDDEHTSVQFSVIIGTPVPPKPDPEPVPPDPKPKPTPVTGEVWLIVIEETQLRTPQTAAVLGDLKFWQSLPIKGWRFYDPTNPEQGSPREYYVHMSRNKMPNTQLPIMMMVDSNANFVAGMALPSNTDAIRKFVKDQTGK